MSLQPPFVQTKQHQFPQLLTCKTCLVLFSHTQHSFHLLPPSAAATAYTHRCVNSPVMTKDQVKSGGWNSLSPASNKTQAGALSLPFHTPSRWENQKGMEKPVGWDKSIITITITNSAISYKTPVTLNSEFWIGLHASPEQLNPVREQKDKRQKASKANYKMAEWQKTEHWTLLMEWNSQMQLNQNRTELMNWKTQLKLYTEHGTKRKRILIDSVSVKVCPIYACTF